MLKSLGTRTQPMARRLKAGSVARAKAGGQSREIGVRLGL